MAGFTIEKRKCLGAARCVKEIVPPDGVAAQLLRETGMGEVVDPEDVDAIVRALVTMRDRFHAEIESGRFQIARGPADLPDIVFDTDATTLRSVVFGGRPVTDVTGDRRTVARFVACFPRPTPFEG